MSNRLWSDLSPSSGRRFWFALNSAPGFISPAPAVLTLNGQQPAAAQLQTVFRTPATATLSLLGLNSSTVPVLTPSPAALTAAGAVPAKQTTLIVTPAIIPNYDDLPGLAPTIIYVQTVTPARALVSLQSIELNVSQGGNIGFVSPALAALSLQGTTPNFVFHLIDASTLTLSGLAPVLIRQLEISPDVGVLSWPGLAPFVGKSFTWVDVAPSPPLLWIREDNVVS